MHPSRDGGGRGNGISVKSSATSTGWSWYYDPPFETGMYQRAETWNQCPSTIHASMHAGMLASILPPSSCKLACMRLNYRGQVLFHLRQCLVWYVVPDAVVPTITLLLMHTVTRLVPYRDPSGALPQPGRSQDTFGFPLRSKMVSHGQHRDNPVVAEGILMLLSFGCWCCRQNTGDSATTRLLPQGSCFRQDIVAAARMMSLPLGNCCTTGRNTFLPARILLLSIGH